MMKYYTEEDVNDAWNLFLEKEEEVRKVIEIHRELQIQLLSDNVHPFTYVHKLTIISSYLSNVQEKASEYSVIKDAIKEEIKDFEASEFLKEKEGSIELKKARVRERAIPLRQNEYVVKLISKKLDTLCSSLDSFTKTSQSFLKWEEKKLPTKS